ncbi:MAG: hypothetical protein ACRD0Z_10085 [Acidimicrobiales bacterium]
MAVWLNQAGHRTRAGRPWSHTAALTVLRNPVGAPGRSRASPPTGGAREPAPSVRLRRWFGNPSWPLSAS